MIEIRIKGWGWGSLEAMARAWSHSWVLLGFADPCSGAAEGSITHLTQGEMTPGLK